MRLLRWSSVCKPRLCFGLALLGTILVDSPARAASEPRTCSVRAESPLQAELQASYRSGEDFSAFAGVQPANDFDEVFESADALFAAIQMGRCQAVVTDGETAAALNLAMARDGIAHGIFEVRTRDAAIDILWKAQGYTSREGFLFARDFKPELDPADVRRFAEYGVTSLNAFQAGVGRMNASGYSTQNTTSALFAFLDDERIGIASGKSAVAVQQARSERSRINAAAFRRAELAEFPYVAFISCGMNGMNISAPACFADSDLEIRNGSDYKLYRIENLGDAGPETNKGLMIRLRRNFQIRAQNSDETLILGVEVQDAVTHQILFQRQASQFRTILFSR